MTILKLIWFVALQVSSIYLAIAAFVALVHSDYAKSACLILFAMLSQWSTK